MKKFFAILAVAALTLSAACTKIETVTPDQKISFKAANYVPQTRSGEVSFLNEFADATNAQFKSKAYMWGTGVDATGDNVTYQDFFGADGETIKWDGTEWAPTHDYYWPKFANSYINFLSWYDNNGAPVISRTGSTFKMEWKDRIIGTGDNIMYADPAWRFKQNNNPATYTAVDGVAQGVPTLFHHSLAQVEFRAYASKVEVTDLLTWTIKLTALKLEVANKGTLTLTATEPTTGNNIQGTWDGTPAWVADATKGNIMPTTFNVTATDATADAAKVLANQVVLPQDLSSTNLTFKLDITTTYAAGQTNHEILDVTIPMGTAEGFNTAAWALNTKYVYTIKIEPAENRVLFDPAVEKAWEVVTVPEKVY